MRTSIGALCALGVVAFTVPSVLHAASPRVVATQPGLVRQVHQSATHVVWTRCRSKAGPTELWAATRRPGKRHWRVPKVRVKGDCGSRLTLLGVLRNQAITQITNADGQTRIQAINVRRGGRRLITATQKGPLAHRIFGADVAGARAVWLRQSSSVSGDYVEVVSADLRAGAAKNGPGSDRRVVYRRGLDFGAVLPTSARVDPVGNVVVAEDAVGIVYGYGAGFTRASLVQKGRPGRRYARPGWPAQLAAADLSRRTYLYVVANPATNRITLFARDRKSGSRRLLRRLRLPNRLTEFPDAANIATAYGTRVAWRERRRLGRRWTDRIIVASVTKKRSLQRVTRTIDTRRQKSYISRPSLFGRSVAWSQITYRRPVGNLGAYLGLAKRPARSQILLKSVR